MLCQQVTRAVDPATEAASILLYDATFVQPNGTQVNTNTNWLTYSDNDGGYGTAFTFTDGIGNFAVIQSNLVQSSTAGSGHRAGVIVAPAAGLALTFPYIVRVIATLIGTTSTHSVGLLGRLNRSNYGDGNCVTAEFHATSSSAGVCFLRSFTTTATGAFSAGGNNFQTGVPALFELRDGGPGTNAVQAYVNDVLCCEITTTTNDTYFDTGYSVGGGTGGTAGEGVSEFLAYAATPLASYRATNVILVSSGSIYVGDISHQAGLATNGSLVLSPSIKPQGASSQGYVFFVDTIHDIQQLNLATRTVEAYGTGFTILGSETATTLGKYSLACFWRDRLVLASSVANPQNVIMSRQSNHFDWDYSQLDPAAAFAMNANAAGNKSSGAGGVGEPLNCLIPFSDDVLFLGGDHNTFAIQGDPAGGGQVVILSDSIGTLGPDCWDADPAGTVYFVGTTGLFRIAKGSTQVVDITQGRIRDFFVQIDRVNDYVCLAWDRDRNGCWIFVTPVITGVTTHLFYDATNDAFFPQQFPTNFGPITAVTYDGDGPSDRVTLLGCRDGYLRKWDLTAATDDGTAISSYVHIGPIRPILKQVGYSFLPDEQTLGILQSADLIFGEDPPGFTDANWNCQLDVMTGKDAYTAINTPERTLTLIFNASARRKKILQRTTGGVYYFKLSNAVSGKIFQFEKLSVDFADGGLQRRW